MSGAERQAAYTAKIRSGRHRQRGRTEPALASRDAKAKARPKTKGQPKAKASVGGRRPVQRERTWRARTRFLIAEIARLKQSIERRAKAPPPEPGSEAERTIKGLRTQVKNLKAQLAHLTSDDDVGFFGSNSATGAMSFAVYTKIAKCLHSDAEPPTAAERAAAMRALNSWKADQKKAKAAR